MDWHFFLEVLVGGLLSGIMYALVALGFVLIYKASGVFNFAQGAMVFFAALSFVGFMELGLPFWAALPVTIGMMVLVGMGTERFVLRPLVNQHEITLLMATIGLTFVIEGVAQLAWGVQVRRLDLGIEDQPMPWLADNTGLFISQIDLFAAVVAGILVSILAVVFNRTGLVARSERWPMTMRQLCRLVSHSKAFGLWCGALPVWWLWWQACCGVRAQVCSSRWCLSRSKRCQC